MDLYLFANEYVFGFISLIISVITFYMTVNINSKLKTIRKIDIRRDHQNIIAEIDQLHSKLMLLEQINPQEVHKIATKFDWLQKRYELPNKDFETIKTLIYNLLNSHDQETLRKISESINDIKRIIMKGAEL